MPASVSRCGDPLACHEIISGAVAIAVTVAA
jgi:hypothetical protein